MDNKKLLEEALKGYDWLEENPEAWKWENGHRVLLAQDAPDFVKYVIEAGNKGIDNLNKREALLNKLEGN